MFHVKRKPVAVEPEPVYVLRSPAHGNALACMLGINERIAVELKPRKGVKTPRDCPELASMLNVLGSDFGRLLGMPDDKGISRSFRFMSEQEIRERLAGSSKIVDLIFDYLARQGYELQVPADED